MNENRPEPAVAVSPAIEEGDVLLQVNHLKKYFPVSGNLPGRKKQYVRAVDDVSLQVRVGRTVGIVGESGCGKTTMGRTILRLHSITGGEVLFDGVDIGKLKPRELRKMRPQMQMIFQDPYSSLSPRMTVGEIIGEAVRQHKIVPPSEYKDYIFEVMEKCGLQPQYFERYPHEFSGGQRQRICIARALALKPKLVICDEPVSALDVSIQAQIINLLKSLQERDKIAYIFISHDLSVVEHISDEVGVMYLGSMVEYGKTADIFEKPAASLHGSAVLGGSRARSRLQDEEDHSGRRHSFPGQSAFRLQISHPLPQMHGYMQRRGSRLPRMQAGPFCRLPPV